MAAASHWMRSGARIVRGPRQTRATIAFVVATRAPAEPLDVRGAWRPKPEPIFRQSYACPRQHRRGLLPRADDEHGGLFQSLRLFGAEPFRRRILRHVSQIGRASCRE